MSAKTAHGIVLVVVAGGVAYATYWAITTLFS